MTPRHSAHNVPLVTIRQLNPHIYITIMFVFEANLKLSAVSFIDKDQVLWNVNWNSFFLHIVTMLYNINLILLCQYYWLVG